MKFGNYNLYTLKNGKMEVTVTDFGATVVSIFVEDKDGIVRDVVLGYDDGNDYQKNWSFFGATVGRYANRISDAKCVIEGVEYALENNDRGNTLHSGRNTLSKKQWQVKEETDSKIVFSIEAPHLEQGFPGNAVIEVTYEVTADQTLEITYLASADQTTSFNMTNHSYFNLDGHEAGNVCETLLWIDADGYTPVRDGHAIPTGEIATVESTPFDFRTQKEIGRDIGCDHPQLGYGSGYDHNFALNHKEKGSYDLIAKAYSKKTGIEMEVLTDAPGVQLYTANFIKGQIGKGGVHYEDRGAFCLETQCYPNAINEQNFETPITKVGEFYRTKTGYRFKVK